MKNIFKILVLCLLSLPSFGQKVTQGKASGWTKLNPASALKKGTNANQFLMTVASDSTVRYFDQDTVAQILGIGGGAALVEEITYAALLDKIDEEELSAGKKYIITDFKTTFNLNISNTLYEDATVEPIVVTAKSSYKLEPIAYSISHPKDILYYDVDGSTYMPGSTKGCIYRRIDTEKNISVPFDFREFKVEAGYDASSFTTWGDEDTYDRGTIVKEAGILYISKKGSNLDNSVSDAAWWQSMGAIGNAKALRVFDFFGINNFTVNDDVSSPSLCFNISDSYNFVINQQPASIDLCLFLTYGYIKDCTFDRLDNCFFNTEDDMINNHCGVVKDYILTSGEFANNNLAGVQGLITGQFDNNTFGKGLANNYLAYARNNTIQSEFTGNIADANFRNNTIGLRCQNNNLAANFGNDDDESQNYGNTIGNDFKNNTTLGSAFGNVIGNNCNGNTWGAWFMNNHLSNNFYSNVCGSNFQNNNLPFDFYSNITGNDFQNWNGQCKLNGEDFTGLTLPATAISKYILYDEISGVSWGYWTGQTPVFTPF